MAKNKNVIQSPVEKELNVIKRLLILLLAKKGASLSELSIALRMDPADISRMFPVSKIKKYKEQ